MLKLRVDYPSRAEEKEILERMTGPSVPQPARVITTEAIASARRAVAEVYVDDRLKDYVVSIVHATRRPQEHKIDIAGLIQYGASPRATIYLATAAKAHAFVRGRGYVTPEDVKAIGPDVLRHRIILTYEAEAQEVTTEEVVRRIFDAVEVP